MINIVGINVILLICYLPNFIWPCIVSNRGDSLQIIILKVGIIGSKIVFPEDTNLF